jgi:hypothetical protein
MLWQTLTFLGEKWFGNISFSVLCYVLFEKKTLGSETIMSDQECSSRYCSPLYVRHQLDKASSRPRFNKSRERISGKTYNPIICMLIKKGSGDCRSCLRKHKNFTNCVSYEVLTAVVMKSFILWDIAPCSPSKVNRLFGGKYLCNFQFFDPENGAYFFIWNVCLLSTDCAVLYPRKWNSLSKVPVCMVKPLEAIGHKEAGMRLMSHETVAWSSCWLWC